jgi:hypothetical protein
MSSENVSSTIAKFAADVRRALAHLSADQIAELTGDLEANITASVADGSPIPEVEEYVNELLSAAGLAVPHSAAVSKYVDVVAIVRSATRGLSPMWWLVRAIATTAVLGSLTSTRPAFGAGFNGIRVADRGYLGLLVFVIALVASVWSGRQEKRWPWPLRVAPAVAVVFVFLGQIGGELKFASAVYNASSVSCAGLGFDSMGRRDFPTEPFPELAGLSLFDADKKVTEWGGGLAWLNLVRGGEVAMSPRAAIVDVGEPFISFSGGGCPSVSVEVVVAESPVTTAPPVAVTTRTSEPMATSSTTVPSSTTYPGFAVESSTTTSIYATDTTAISASATTSPEG